MMGHFFYEHSNCSNCNRWLLDKNSIRPDTGQKALNLLGHCQSTPTSWREFSPENLGSHEVGAATEEYIGHNGIKNRIDYDYD